MSVEITMSYNAAQPNSVTCFIASSHVSVLITRFAKHELVQIWLRKFPFQMLIKSSNQLIRVGRSNHTKQFRSKKKPLPSTQSIRFRISSKHVWTNDFFSVEPLKPQFYSLCNSPWIYELNNTISLLFFKVFPVVLNFIASVYHYVGFG